MILVFECPQCSTRILSPTTPPDSHNEDYYSSFQMRGIRSEKLSGFPTTWTHGSLKTTSCLPLAWVANESPSTVRNFTSDEQVWLALWENLQCIWVGKGGNLPDKSSPRTGVEGISGRCVWCSGCPRRGSDLLYLCPKACLVPRPLAVSAGSCVCWRTWLKASNRLFSFHLLKEKSVVLSHVHLGNRRPGPRSMCFVVGQV